MSIVFSVAETMTTTSIEALVPICNFATEHLPFGFSASLRSRVCTEHLLFGVYGFFYCFGFGLTEHLLLGFRLFGFRICHPAGF